MKIKLLIVPALLSLIIVSSCEDKAVTTVKPFCDTACLKDTLKFANQAHEAVPKLAITPYDCLPDSILWTHRYLATNKKMPLSSLTGRSVRIDSNFVKCYFTDTSHVWIEFNDCNNGRGYVFKLPFNKAVKMTKSTAALTRFNPKFKIADGIVCYSDYTKLYVEDVNTGKIETMEFSKTELDIDFDNIHASFDSANVTRDRIYLVLLENGQKKPVEKKISL